MGKNISLLRNNTFTGHNKQLSTTTNLRHLPYRNRPFHGSTGSGLFIRGSTLQQLPASCPEHSPDFSRACRPWKSLPPICWALMLLQQSGVLGFVSSTSENWCFWHGVVMLTKALCAYKIYISVQSNKTLTRQNKQFLSTANLRLNPLHLMC